MADLSRRIIKETQKIVQEPPPGISAHPHDDNMRHFDVIMAGPVGSAYEGAPCSVSLNGATCLVSRPPRPRPRPRDLALSLATALLRCP